MVRRSTLTTAAGTAVELTPALLGVSASEEPRPSQNHASKQTAARTIPARIHFFAVIRNPNERGPTSPRHVSVGNPQNSRMGLLNGLLQSSSGCRELKP